MSELIETSQGKQYRGVREIKGPLLFLEGAADVGYDEIVEIRGSTGIERMGKVLEVSKDLAVIQVFGDPTGLQIDSVVSFKGSAFQIPVSAEILGRVFNGKFDPIDGLPPIFSRELKDINGSPINPKARVYPSEFIQTGVSAIDGMMSLIRGQKLPIFSESGLPHNRLLAQILRQATVLGENRAVDRSNFAVVFAAMGLKNDEVRFFVDELKKSGTLARSVLVLNLADDPAVERLFTPRIALTAAEHLAFDLDYHVLTILSDMTNYAEALRELSSAREEVPGKAGYPGYLYSDLASIFERAGIIEGKKGSLTQMPVLTMPGGDFHHPIPDLTGYITEGQIFLDRDLNSRGIYPPINVLPSLSRLMRKGVGSTKTREDHHDVSDQLYDSYAQGVKAKQLARIVGEMELSERERSFLKFAEAFDRQFISQSEYENRSVQRTLDIAWEALSILPEDELVRIREEFLQKYHSKYRK